MRSRTRRRTKGGAPRSTAIVTFPEAVARAVARHQAGHWVEAEHIYKTILEARPDHFDALHLLGVLEAQRGRLVEADRLLSRALCVDAQSPEARSNHGNVQRALGHPEQALASYERALAIRPAYVEALNNRGVALQELRQYDGALASYDQALAIKPDYADALVNRGNTLRILHRHAEALASFDAALAIVPNHAEALNNRGATLEELNRYGYALASYDRALAIRPEYVDALNNRGVVLAVLLRHEEALVCYDQAVALDPDHENALTNRGHALLDLGRHDEAIREFERVRDLRPDALLTRGLLLHSRMQCCDWRAHADAAAALIADVRAGRPVTAPFAFLGIADSVQDQLRCAETWVREKCAPSSAPLWTGERYEHDRIRVAYIAADFHDHPMARLTAGLFERHDRARFATTAVSFGPAVPGALRTRLEGAFERFIDVRQSGNDEVATLLRDMEIDIAIDLTGHARACRTAIFARRPAPVQVNFLGFPGTMGAKYIDYIIADRFVIPPACCNGYTEKLVHLPDTFQANDIARPVAKRTPTRVEVGLPEGGFVFCCFNNTFKLTPLVFDVWARLVRRVEGSVLWVLGGNPVVEANLEREASARGIEPKRLVFAGRVPYEDYLARYRLADLFLDTLPFNAGTTASDALWAGTPVLTCAGEAFAARMAGSVLTAAGLPELITCNLDEYEARAFDLATVPGLLAKVNRKLARNRRSCPLFDTDRFCRHFEAALVQMWDRYQRGEPPSSFEVAKIA